MLMVGSHVGWLGSLIRMLMDSTSLRDTASSSALGSQKSAVVVPIFPGSMAINAGKVKYVISPTVHGTTRNG